MDFTFWGGPLINRYFNKKKMNRASKAGLRSDITCKNVTLLALDIFYYVQQK